MGNNVHGEDHWGSWAWDRTQARNLPRLKLRSCIRPRSRRNQHLNFIQFQKSYTSFIRHFGFIPWPCERGTSVDPRFFLRQAELQWLWHLFDSTHSISKMNRICLCWIALGLGNFEATFQDLIYVSIHYLYTPFNILVFTNCFSVVLCETLDSFRESVSDLTSIIADTWENLPRFENAAINLI